MFCVYPPIVYVLCIPFCWALIAVNTSVRNIYLQADRLQDLLSLPWKVSCAGADPSEPDLLQWGSVARWVCPLSLLLVEVVWWSFDVVWSSIPVMLALEPLGKCSSGSALAVFCIWSPYMNYKAICRWLLLVLGLEVPQRGQAVNQGLLPLLPGLGPLCKRYGSCWGQMLLVWETLGKSEAWAKTSHSYGKAAGNSLGRLQVVLG